MNAPIRTDWISELCVALAHRWQPERLFVALAYTAYLDESGTHAESEVTVLGGLLARADQWRKFQKGFDTAKAKHGFRIFHTKKFKRRDGDFKGWSNNRCLDLMGDLGALTSSGLTDGITVALDNADYQRYFKGTEPTKTRLDSKYGLCFRMCLYYLVIEVSKRKYRGKIPDLHLILEAGHANAGDAQRIFHEVKKEFAERGAEMLRSLTFAEKDECDPLMMADFVAHTTLMIHRNARADGTDTPPSQNIPRGQTGITHVQSTPEALAAMRNHMGEWLRRSPNRGPAAASSERSS